MRFNSNIFLGIIFIISGIISLFGIGGARANLWGGTATPQPSHVQLILIGILLISMGLMFLFSGKKKD